MVPLGYFSARPGLGVLVTASDPPLVAHLYIIDRYGPRVGIVVGRRRHPKLGDLSSGK